MGELQAIEKLLKAPLPVVGGAPWAADVVAAAPKPGQNRGQRPGNGGRQGQKLTAKPQGTRSGKPSGQRPGGQGKPGSQRQGQGKPQGGSFAPRRPEGQNRRPG
jgi:ATP-dependent RNA helicase RhlE